jgi:Zn-dependent protease with chaperone function
MESLVHEKEKIYFTISVVVSALIYIGLAVSVVGLFYVALGLLVAVIAQGMLMGGIRGNSIRISPQQFPEIFAITEGLAQKMSVVPTPDVYIVQAGGLLNAFATRFLGRNFVIIYSDVFELAYRKGESELAFIIAHELAHIKRKHLIWRIVLMPAVFIPYLSTAYSRACEYTCDRFGAHFVPQGAMGGLLVLAAGKKLYQHVDSAAFESQVQSETGFWVWYAEIFSSHPNLPKRIQAVRQQIGAAPVTSSSATAAGI